MPDYAQFESVEVELTDRVAVCTLNRPDRLNAVDRRMHGELQQALRMASRDKDVGAIVLTGAGRAFCAGGDVKGMRSKEGDGPDAAEPPTVARMLMDRSRQMAVNLLAIEKPLIAAVNGAAVGLGCTMALSCDVIYIADTAKIGDPHVKVGLAPGDGGAALWPLLVGPSRAKEYLMTGDLIPAEEAERIGLVNHVAPADRVLDDAVAFASRLAKGPAMAVRFAKLSVQRSINQSFLHIQDTALALEAITSHSQDHKEAVRAFRDKREPQFKGR